MIKKVFSDFSFDIVVNLAAQAGDVPITYADTSLLEADTGFKPNTELRKFAEWYKEFYKV